MRCSWLRCQMLHVRYRSFTIVGNSSAADPVSNRFGIFRRRGKTGSCTSKFWGCWSTRSQKLSYADSVLSDIKVSTVISATFCLSAAESSFCCNVLLRLSVCPRMSAPKFTPKKKSKQFYVNGRLLYSISRQIPCSLQCWCPTISAKIRNWWVHSVDWWL